MKKSSAGYGRQPDRTGLGDRLEVEHRGVPNFLVVATCKDHRVKDIGDDRRGVRIGKLVLDHLDLAKRVLYRWLPCIFLQPYRQFLRPGDLAKVEVGHRKTVHRLRRVRVFFQALIQALDLLGVVFLRLVVKRHRQIGFVVVRLFRKRLLGKRHGCLHVARLHCLHELHIGSRHHTNRQR